MKNDNNLLLYLAATAVVIGSAGFFGGMKYQQAKQSSFQFGPGSGMMGGNVMFKGNGEGGTVAFRQGQGQGVMGQGMRPVAGEIINQDDKSITVKTQDGSSKIIILSDTTTINKASEATQADLKTGETVSVFGTINADGSVTAQNIQLNPLFRAQIEKTAD